MKRYLDQVRARVDDLEAKIIQIPRGENPGGEVRLNKRCLVQKRLLSSIFEMLGYRRGRLHHEGDTRGHLRKPFGVKVISAQAYASRVLLPHHVEGCRGLC